MAPACLRCATIGASISGIESFSATIPCVVAEPTTSNASLTVMGTPCSGPTSSPAAIVLSASRAARKASSFRTTVTAFTMELTASMRSRWAWITSWLDSCRSRMAVARLVALHCQRGRCEVVLMRFATGSERCGAAGLECRLRTWDAGRCHVAIHS